MSALVALICLATPGWAEVGGTVRDAWSEAPVGGARVTDAATGETVQSDGAGVFRLGGAQLGATLFVEGGGRALTRYVVRGEQVVIDAWSLSGPTGAPARWRLHRPPGPMGGPVELPVSNGGPLRLAVEEGALPDTIRVGRRLASSCRDAPVQRVDEIDLDEYVEGVVNAEVGVFRAVQGGPAAAAATWAAFGVAARSYALWFYLRDPDAEFHIDDTACNQVYKDARNADVDAALIPSRGVVMVKASDRRTLDKLEYAASCGEHGSLPEYGSVESLVPDAIPERACAGNWCGHDNCAAHEVNPHVPDAGRCLVRGICQWGAVERSMRGDSWQEILGHYQPHLTLLGLEGVPDPQPHPDPDPEPEPEPDPDPAPAGEIGTLVGFVRNGTAQGPGIPGATVSAGEIAPVAADADGFYRIEEVPIGQVLVRAEAPDQLAQSQSVDVQAGGTHWASFALLPIDAAPPDDDGGEVIVADGSDPVDAPGAGGDVQDASLAPSRRSGSVGCSTAWSFSAWRPRR